MSRADGFLVFITESVEDIQADLNKKLAEIGYETISATVSDETGDIVATFSNGEDSSSIVLSVLDGLPSVIIPDDDGEEDISFDMDGVGFLGMFNDPEFLRTTLAMAGMIDGIEFEDEEEEDEEDNTSPDAYGYVEGNETTDEGVAVGPKKAKFVIRGGKKKKIFVRKKKMRMRGSERMKRKRGAKVAARKRKAKKFIMARKRKKSLAIRGRMHIKPLKGWRKK